MVSSAKPRLRRTKRILAAIACLLLALVFAGIHARWATLIDFETEERRPRHLFRYAKVSREADEILGRLHRAGQFSGSVLIGFSGKVIYSRSYGFADADRRIPNSSSTRFSIGSVSKQFTGFLVQDLVDRGKLQLSDTVSRHVPELRGAALGRVTVDQLLHHTSGLPLIVDKTTFIGLQLDRRRRTEAEFIEEIAGYELAFTPGSAFLYSNVGYTLLSVIIHRVTGSPWEAELRHRIFEPHGMYSSGSLDTETPIVGLARGYLPVRQGGLAGEPALLALPRWNYSMIRGAGAVYSSARDLFQWDRALRILAVTRPRLFERYMAPGPFRSYASGWGVNKVTLGNKRQVTIYQHDGEDPGYYAFFARIPEMDAAIILLSNSDYDASGTDYQLPQQLLNMLLAFPYRVVTSADAGG